MTQQPVTVSQTEEGIRLNRWFARHYPSVSLPEFYKLCRTGQIRVNAGRIRGNEILYAGDVIRVPPLANARSEKAQGIGHKAGSGENFNLRDLEDLRKRIIHDDADIVIFDKPAGLAVQGGSGIKKSLDKMVAAMYPYDTPLMVHRLDRETSGIIVVAKNQMAAQNLSAEFAGKIARKEYLALLHGTVAKKSGVIDNFLAKGVAFDNEEEADAFVGAGPKPRRAITKYRVLNELPGILSLVQFFPETGRTHQLRLHAAKTLNAPIVGDTLYGDTKFNDSQMAALVGGGHLFLVAHRLSFRHPRTGAIMNVTVDLPAFMKPVVEFLGWKKSVSG